MAHFWFTILTHVASQTLYAAGIVPSNTATYTLKEINAAISAQFGQDPVLLCDDSTISQIYVRTRQTSSHVHVIDVSVSQYGFYVTGPLVNQDFVPAAVVGDDSTCPSSGIKYPVKVEHLQALWEHFASSIDLTGFSPVLRLP